MQLLIGWIITNDSNFKISVSAQDDLLNISIKEATNRTRNTIVEEVLWDHFCCINEQDHPHKSIFRGFGKLGYSYKYSKTSAYSDVYSPRWALVVL